MKATNIFKLFAFISLISITSCVDNNDFEIPDVTVQEPTLTGDATTFNSVVSAYNQAVANGDATVTFDTDLYITGYVISSDKASNFFKEIIIQNVTDDSSPVDNPRLGFKIPIDQNGLYQNYEFGRKVYINLNGLTFGVRNGVYNLGKETTLDRIPSFEVEKFVVRGSEVVSISPKVTSIGALTEADENTYIQLNNMQFTKDMLGKTYAGENSDSFDGSRLLESCDDNLTIPLETSTFADFKSIAVSNKKGSITGIFSRNFSDNQSVLNINSMSDIMFEETDRCDPIELDCGLASAEGANSLFADNFESQSANSAISGNGWTNYAEAGTQTWQAYTATGSNASIGVSARIGSFRSNDASTIAWLITPQIDMDAQDGETLTFKTSNSFADGSDLEILFSTDWDGTEANIKTATWGILPKAYVAQDSDAFSSWFDSGIVDLSCATGKIYIAFKYTGSGDSGFDGTYELDEIKISSN